MPLSKREREEFLAEPHIAALSVAAAPDRAPLTVPIWYHYEPGGDPWVLTGAESRKWQLLEAAGRFTLMVDRLEPTARYVSVEGPIAHTEPATDEHVWQVASRYLPDEKAKAYLGYHNAVLGEHVVVSMRPQRWLSADMGGW
ncbi:MAG: pyridoxamine 5'-phosphate oxidase family protein [Pseudonocardia sp.]